MLRASAPPEPPRRTAARPGVLKDPGFRRLWAVGGLTGTMRWLEILVVSLLVLEMTGSAVLVSMSFFFRMAPMLMFGIVMGILADRINRKAILLAGLVVQAAVSGILGVMLVLDVLVYWHLALGVFVSGIVWSSEFPVRRAMIGEVVGADGIGRAMGVDSATNNFSRVIGPFAGGWFFATIGPASAFFVGVLLFGIAAVVAVTLRYRPVAPSKPPGRVFSDLAEGFRYIRASRLMVGTLVVTMLMNMFAFPYQSQAPVIASDYLGVGPVLVGLLGSMEGVGAVLGALLIAGYAQQRHYTRIYLYGSLLFLVTILFFAVSDWYLLSLVIVFVGGFGMAAFGTMQSTIMVSASSPEMRGRVMGATAISIGASPVGQLNIGALAGLMDPRAATMTTALLGLLTVGVSALMWPVLRRADSMESDRTERTEREAATPAPQP